MRCHTVRKNIYLYFENKLNIKRKQKITEHLRTCAWCMNEYKQGEHILNVMRGSLPKEMPENLHKSIMREVHGLKSYNEEHKKEVLFMFGRFAKRACMVCLSVLIATVTICNIDMDFVKEKGKEGFDLGINYFSQLINSERLSDIESKIVNKQSADGMTKMKINVAVDENEKSEMFSSSEDLDLVQIEQDYNDDIYVDKTNDMDITKEYVVNINTSELIDIAQKIKEQAQSEGCIIYKDVKDFSKDLTKETIVLRIADANSNEIIQNIQKEFIVKEISDNMIVNTKREDIKQNLDQLKSQLDVEYNNLGMIIDQSLVPAKQEQIANIISTINSLETKLNDMVEYASIVVNIDEVEPQKLGEAMNFNTFMKQSWKSIKESINSFTLSCQVVIIWCSANWTYIFFFAVVFIITFAILKKIFLNFNE